VSQLTGIVTIFLMLVSRFSFEKLGWRFTALITPLIILMTGSLFFCSAIFMSLPPGSLSLDPNLTALILTVGSASGVIGRVLSKSSKYSLFDPSKEMVYISMEKQERMDGKSTVDILASYFGKSGASWLVQGLVLVCGSLTTALPFVLAIHLFVCSVWTHATLQLASSMPEL
jgi:AAA family ATP:ADP antiporter